MGKEKQEQTRRRLTRRVQEVTALIEAIPAPGGPSLEVQQLEDQLAGGEAPVINWATVPPSCDPITIIAAGSDAPVDALDDATKLRAHRKRWQVGRRRAAPAMRGACSSPGPGPTPARRSRASTCC
jgi:hypothetical protein